MARRERRRPLHREPVVRTVAALLDRGEPTRFAHEGICRAVLRSSMCLAGRRWAQADDRARAILLFAFHRIGLVRRPTWQEGQPEHRDIEHYYCANCGGRLDDPTRKYCCDLCRMLAKNRRRYHSGGGGARPLTRVPFRACRQCGKSFRPADSRNQYCSHACARAARRIKFAEKACVMCGSHFTPRNRHEAEERRYCSARCARLHQWREGRTWLGRPVPP